MKKFIKIAVPFLFVVFVSYGNAQTIINVCAGTNTAIVTAINSQSLSNPSYSLNPGGISSPNPTFVVSPGPVSYSLYVTGTNSNSAVVTTTNVVTVNTLTVVYSVFSPNSYTLGCNTKSICTVNITNAQTSPISGGAIGYTLLPPGSIGIPGGTLSTIASYTLNVPGTWTVVVRDALSLCTEVSTLNITTNTVSPSVGGVTVPQNPLTCTTPSMVLQIAPNPAVQYEWFLSSPPSSVLGNSILVTTKPAISNFSLVTTATLVTTDSGNGCYSTTVMPIYQNIYKPTAIVSAPTPGVCQNSIALSHTSISNIPISVFPNSAPVIAVLWEGPFPQPTLGLSSLYVAQTTGQYTLTVMDTNNGCTGKTIYNFSAGPAAAFNHTITGGVAAFNNVSTGAGGNTVYFWNFGDGNTSTLPSPTHIYANGGAHLVKLKLMDPISLCSDSVIQSVNISGIPCSANSTFSMVPTATAQVWNVVPSYPWNITAASWNWGDGSSSNTLYTAHQYSAAGMYQICLSVTVSCGDTSTTCTSYSVYRGSQGTSVLLVNVIAPELISGLVSAQTEGQLNWNIAPNPNAGEFKLNISAVSAGVTRVVITDLTGRAVHDQDLESNSASIQTNDLPPGMYLVTLQTGQHKFTKRMVVSR